MQTLIYRGTSVLFLLGVYNPPWVEILSAPGMLNDVIIKQDTAHPDALHNGAGGFNHYNPRNVFPKLYQHISFPPRESNILDQV